MNTFVITCFCSLFLIILFCNCVFKHLNAHNYLPYLLYIGILVSVFTIGTLMEFFLRGLINVRITEIKQSFISILVLYFTVFFTEFLIIPMIVIFINFLIKNYRFIFQSEYTNYLIKKYNFK